MKTTIWKHGGTCLVMSLPMLISGCGVVGGGHSEAHRLELEMESLAIAMKKCPTDRIESFHLIDDFVHCAIEYRLLEAFNVDDKKLDPWGSPLKLETSKHGSKITIQITSLGPNGVFENGQGDDISRVFTIQKK